MRRSAAMLRATLALLALAGCTDALLQPLAADGTTVDDRLAIRGRVCTAKPDPTAFPVKVVFLIDKSGSMCVSDPPGSQEQNGFCQQFYAGAPSVPGRVRALQQLMKTLRPQPNVFVALDPFESKIDNAFPTGQNGQFFTAAKNLDDARIRALQANLGKGTDYQGALAQAYLRIEQDILKSNPQVLPRTKYMVILLTDGAPYPRCAANDTLPASAYASATEPWGIWRDNPADFCNANDADQFVTGFQGGTDRNQNYQLFDAVDRLMALRDKYNVGDIRLHTVLLFNVRAAQACGQICATDLYNGLQPEEMRTAATWMLKQLAETRGNGTFQEFTDASNIELGALDYTSLAARFTAKTFLADNLSALPGVDAPRVDSDGDGLPDNLDAPTVLGTSRFETDTDEDGFSDGFEVQHAADGFDPKVPDSRGCKSINKSVPRFSCRDTDGDGLSEAAEAALGSSPTLFDTDADGIPDGVEAKLGLDPTRRNDGELDFDLDGVPDLAEVLLHANPLARDPLQRDKDGYRYALTPSVDEDGRTCYDYLVSNVRLLTPDRVSGQHGFNLVTLTFGEAPESSVSRDYGAWKMACLYAQFAPPSVRVPVEPEITLTDDAWFTPDRFTPQAYRQLCQGVPP